MMETYSVMVARNIGSDNTSVSQSNQLNVGKYDVVEAKYIFTDINYGCYTAIPPHLVMLGQVVVISTLVVQR